MNPQIYITYEMVFDDEPKSITEYLKVFDRTSLIKIALLLIQSCDKYEGISEYISDFFCKSNITFVTSVLEKLQKRIQEKDGEPSSMIPKSYFLISETTGLELLRQIFSIESFSTPASQIIQEQNLFKAILLINNLVSRTTLKEEYTEKGELSDLFFAKSLFCTFLNNYESNNIDPEYLIILQVIKGYYFFNYCANSKLKEHLRLFLERNGLSSWEQYLYNAIKLLLFPLKNKDGYSMILLNEEGEGYSFLHSHAMQIDTVISIDKNNDYTFFKSHPLIEIDSKTFLPINTLFCINNLYKSIYFEFKSINDQLKGTGLYIKGLRTVFTTEFSEQYLFDTFMQIILKRRRGVKLSDIDCKKIANIGHEPDFYYRDGNNILLFENKDIMIADYLKHSGSYEKIWEAVNKKLVVEAGLSQILHNIKSIDAGNFVWDKTLPKHPRIYPILVMDDSSLCVPGFNYILNVILSDMLKEHNIGIKVFPLSVIELDTIIAFANDFETGKYSLREVIDQYYTHMNYQPRRVEPAQILKEVFKKYFPFNIFFSTEYAHRPFNDELFNEICESLRKATKGNDD